MIRVTRLTDYGIMLLTYMSQDSTLPLRTAPDLAAETRLPLPTVSKILKMLARRGVLVTHRGVNGGFSLARRPETISISEIITALEGPIALTECGADAPGKCQLERLCPVRSNWQRINQAVRAALEHLTLSDMTRPLSHDFVTLGSRRKSAESRR